ncbi:MAG: hypothetical protein AB7S50_00795 [Bacteroidales bacterium]
MKRRISNDNVYIYFIDDDNASISEIIKKSDQLESYNIKIYSKSRDFITDFQHVKPKKQQVYIVFISNHLEIDEEGKSVEVIDVLKKIKSINPFTEVILYSDSDDIDTVSLAFHHGVYTAIKKNDNFILRLENNIKGIISQKNFILKKQSSLFITELFLIFTVFMAILVAILWYFFPTFFLD